MRDEEKRLLQMYALFDELLLEYSGAFQYAEDHYEELMSRPIAKYMYGPPSYGPGAATPSPLFTPDKDRDLREKTRRKQYRVYAFDQNGELLYSRAIRKNGTIDCTYLHFWIGDTNYARAFFGEKKMFYTNILFISKYADGKPTCFAMVDPDRVYVELFENCQDEQGKVQIRCAWYDYYPNRQISERGVVLSKDAPFGEANSPVNIGTEKFEPVDKAISNVLKLNIVQEESR